MFWTVNIGNCQHEHMDWAAWRVLMKHGNASPGLEVAVRGKARKDEK
jgi:hypothetical protein